jgi:hypothetical protein
MNLTSRNNLFLGLTTWMTTERWKLAVNRSDVGGDLRSIRVRGLETLAQRKTRAQRDGNGGLRSTRVRRPKARSR